MIEIIKQALNEYTAYEIAKAIGVTPQSLQKYKNDEASIENMRLGTAMAIVKFQEELNMTLEERILKALAEMDEEIRGGLWDVYEESEGNLWFVDSGMEYDGDDKEAKEVAQVEDGEIINIY